MIMIRNDMGMISDIKLRKATFLLDNKRFYKVLLGMVSQ